MQAFLQCRQWERHRNLLKMDNVRILYFCNFQHTISHRYVVEEIYTGHLIATESKQVHLQHNWAGSRATE